MERLWSPWRSAHVTQWDDRAEHDRARVFSRIAESEEDEANLVLWRGNEVFVVMNLYPYNNGHCLVVPYRRIATYTELSDQERAELSETLSKTMHWIDHALSPDGYNVGMNIGMAAGAGIPDHIHAHVVPRWSGDTNFMATLSETRVIPEALRATYDRIRAAVETIG